MIKTILVGLGFGISKGVLKLWLKDYPVAASSWGSILDVFKSKTNDMLAQNSGKRQFEQIAENVSKNYKTFVADQRGELTDPQIKNAIQDACLLYTSPSPRD